MAINEQASRDATSKAPVLVCATAAAAARSRCAHAAAAATAAAHSRCAHAATAAADAHLSGIKGV